MRKPIVGAAAMLIGLLLLPFSASANPITNPTFDTDLAGWTISATTGVTWVAGEARVGQSGTPGFAVFSQDFNIAAGTSGLSIDFDYAWQVNPPILEDFFSVDFTYQSTGGPVATNLLTQGSNSATFGSVVSPWFFVGLTNLANIPANGTISFRLDENNAGTPGTRIHLDNVEVKSVPEPGIISLLGLGLLGIGLTRRRRLKV